MSLTSQIFNKKSGRQRVHEFVNLEKIGLKVGTIQILLID